MSTTCDLCGTVEDDPQRLLAWTVSFERGRRQDLCVTCARRHLRALEGKLDSEHW
ncbi:MULTISPECIES: hypothetical protein [Nocardioides]|uniref:Small CPxCG-related zinc finger protein n=1 Tax=Nocardioides kribbensis TaxID=305517 RepID=A0ABV1NTP5_9ACTN|nr:MULTISPECIES: hypothetical protein [Nocardioides]MCM3515782.1 hypothetical protein [Nocardioides sp. P86]